MGDMLGAGGEMQQRLGLGGPSELAAEQQLAKAFGPWRATGLAGVQNGQAGCFQRLGETAGLGRFACPLPAFQGDETARPVAGPVQLPKTMWVNAAAARAGRPSRLTSAPASSGMFTSGMPDPVMVSRPSVAPRLIGAGIGLS